MAAVVVSPSSVQKLSFLISSPRNESFPRSKSLAVESKLRYHTHSYSTHRTMPFAVPDKTSASSSASSSSEKALNRIIVIDNYDSFTYNLCQYLGELGCEIEVYRNDELTVDELKRKNPRGVVISPGPGTPQDSGISLQTVLEVGPTVPLFGVCMGLQCIGEAFGGKIVRSPFGVVHGKGSPVYYNEGGEDGLFTGLSNPFTAARYHSLVIEKESFPSNALEITAWTEDGLIMAARHRQHRHIQGVQFHPESIISDEGKAIVHNFIKLVEKKEAAAAAASAPADSMK
ncbi:anthranilate synthase beta subunit 2, chloroplastic-like [Andrographis paniculata]|uniref:anthranilate synthase beta subunit 2, chloroplastic-like n=1 Tax=Andrographis paniculata TaxID=175694 RepID=UPI0021E94041|nr:anthranilate synthase beta subunit 2, chloroplastic-like [Andrographis paniculata]